MLQEALALDRKHGDMLGAAIDQQSLAAASLRAGRAREARDLLSSTLDYVVSSGDTEFLANTLELSACVAADLGDGLRAARLAGAAEGIREQAGMPIPAARRGPARAVPGPGPRDHPTPGVGRRTRRRPRAHPAAGGHAPRITHPQHLMDPNDPRSGGPEEPLQWMDRVQYSS